MDPLKFLSKLFGSKPAMLAIGAGIGLLGLYAVSKMNEKKKMRDSQRELEEAAKILQSKDESETS